MKKLLSVALCSTLFLTAGVSIGAEKAPQKVIDLAKSELVRLGDDAIIIKAVKEENAKGKTLAQIKEHDAEWTSTPGIADYMKALVESECGRHLRDLQNTTAYYSEIFVMDNQGANVCMTDKTSDYWQGDEDKFTESFKDGNGAVHISNVKFDDSTQAYLVQISVPVKDGGKVIGAVTIGVSVDNI